MSYIVFKLLLIQITILKQLLYPIYLVYNIIFFNILDTTVNNGYLGSYNDEERSKMRYVM